VFVNDAFAELLGRGGVKHRFGAVGRHESIAAIGRGIRTLKYEWLRRVPVITGPEHLGHRLSDCACYCNGWRPHFMLTGAVPDLTHAGEQWSAPGKAAKAVPTHLEHRVFPETRITTSRLAA
jgi:hypothetical protein